MKQEPFRTLPGLVQGDQERHSAAPQTRRRIPNLFSPGMSQDGGVRGERTPWDVPLCLLLGTTGPILAKALIVVLVVFVISVPVPRPASAAVVLSSFEGTPDRIAGQVRLVWKTASQLDTAGFNLYRSDRTEGPYMRINPQLVPATPETVVGNTYEYLDRNVTSGQTYYYQLEELEINGRSTRFPPTAVPVPAAPGPMTLGLAFAAGVLLLGTGGFVLLRRRARVPV